MRSVILNVGMALVLSAQLCAGAALSEWSDEAGPPGAWAYVVLAGSESIESRLRSAASNSDDDSMEMLRNVLQTMRRTMAGKLGVTAEVVDFSRPTAFALFSPVMDQSRKSQWRVASFAPVKGDSPGVELVNGYAVNSDSTELVGPVRSAFASARSIKAPKGVARTYMDFAAIKQSPIGRGVEALILKALLPRKGVPNANLHTWGFVLAKILSLSDQIKSITLDLDVSSDGVRVSADITPRWGTDMGEAASSWGRGTALVSVVPDGALTLSANIEGMGEFLLSFTDMFLNIVPDRKEADSIRRPLFRLVRVLGDEFALAYDLGPEGLSVDMAAKFVGSVEVVREYYRFMASGKLPESLKETMKVRPAHVDLAFTENARQVDGVMIDRLTMKFNVQEGIPPIQAFGLLGLLMNPTQETASLWKNGEVVTDYAVVNDTWVVTMGGKSAGERIATLISRAKNPPSPAGDAAVKFKLPLLDLAKFVMKARGGTPPAELEAGEPVTGTAAFAGRTIAVRITLPLKTAARMEKLAQWAK